MAEPEFGSLSAHAGFFAPFFLGVRSAPQTPQALSGRMLREMSIGNDSRCAARWAERVERFEISASHCGDYSSREHKLIVHAYKGMRKSG